jgi:hypothetical protein
MKIETRDCRDFVSRGISWRESTERFFFGHAPHTFKVDIWRWPFRKVYRCRGSQPYEEPPTTEELILAEVREIKWLLTGEA